VNRPMVPDKMSSTKRLWLVVVRGTPDDAQLAAQFACFCEHLRHHQMWFDTRGA